MSIRQAFMNLHARRRTVEPERPLASGATPGEPVAEHRPADPASPQEGAGQSGPPIGPRPVPDAAPDLKAHRAAGFSAQPTVAADGPVSTAERVVRPGYHDIAARLHRQVLDDIDLKAAAQMPAQRLRIELSGRIERLIAQSGEALNATERRQLVLDVCNEVTGLGPLEPLLADPAISDILVNGPHRVFVERHGRLERIDTQFADDAHVLRIIDRIVSRMGRRIDESSPMVDARLEDGSRVNAIIAPLALDGPCLSIRRFSAEPLRTADLIANGTLTEAMARLLEAMVRTRLNLIISGGTGSGKTTLLNMLSGAISPGERIVTIEDAAELRLQQPHVVRLETRPPNLEGSGEVDQRALVRNSLRMRPDRIILGEVRGAEAFDMLQAMNTGHEGSLATVHANTPRDALARLENMIGMAGMPMTPRAIRQQIASAISAVVQVARLADGQRRITHVAEITGMEGDVISMQEVFRFEQEGIGARGEVLGAFRATGIRSHFSERMRAAGAVLPEGLFR